MIIYSILLYAHTTVSSCYMVLKKLPTTGKSIFGCPNCKYVYGKKDKLFNFSIEKKNTISTSRSWTKGAWIVSVTDPIFLDYTVQHTFSSGKMVSRTPFDARPSS